jgi:PAS domain S-box-containing protein
MCLTTDQLRAWGTTLAALTALAGAQEPNARPELQETLLGHWRWVRFDADDGLPDGHFDLLVESRGGVPWASTPLGVALRRLPLAHGFEVPRPLLRSPAFVVPLVLLASLALGLGLLLALRKQREGDALRESEARFRQLTENMSEVFWLVDWLRQKLLYISPSYDIVWGRSSRELLAGSVHWQSGIHAEDRERVVRRFMQLAPRGQFDEEYRIVRADGELRWLRDRAYPIQNAQGQVHRIAGRTQDITERKQAATRQELLTRELDHRVKNTLAGVLALTEQTAQLTTEPDEFRRSIAGRIRAMARAHEALAAGRWAGVPLDVLVDGIVRPYAARPGQVRADGPATVLPPHMSTPICMALHELTTNAVKHGALSEPQGHVEITWRTLDGELELTWRERGGPSCADAPRRNGLGLSLVHGVAEHELQGSATIEFAAAGLIARLCAPLTSDS